MILFQLLAVLLLASVRGYDAISVYKPDMDNLPTVELQDPHRGGLPRRRVPPRPRHVSRGVLPVHAGWPGRLDDRGGDVTRDTCAEPGTRRSTSVRPAPRSTPSCSSATGRGTGWTACATRPPTPPPRSPPSPPSPPPPPLRAPGGWSATTAPGPSTDPATASLMWATSTPSPAHTSTTGGWILVLEKVPSEGS